MTAVRTVKQFLTYVSGGPFQSAVAEALALPDDFYASISADLRVSVTSSCAGLAAPGFEVYRRRGPTSSRPTCARSGTTDGMGSAASCRPGRGGRHPSVGVLRRPRGGPVAGAVGVLQEAGGPGRGARLGARAGRGAAGLEQAAVAEPGRRRAGGGGTGWGEAGRGRPGWRLDAIDRIGPPCIDHVSDVGAARDFYTRVLGLTERADPPISASTGPGWTREPAGAPHRGRGAAGARAALRPDLHRSGRCGGGAARARCRRHRPGAGRPGPPGVCDSTRAATGSNSSSRRRAGDRRGPRAQSSRRRAVLGQDSTARRSPSASSGGTSPAAMCRLSSSRRRKPPAEPGAHGVGLTEIAIDRDPHASLLPCRADHYRRAGP